MIGLRLLKVTGDWVEELAVGVLGSWCEYVGQVLDVLEGR